jgi:hypothetical protein
MFKKLLPILFLFAGFQANAALVKLKWNTTVESVTGGHPGVVGESLITTIQVDNGGTSIINQSWSTSDFVKYRVDGASGWWFESIAINNTADSFTTGLNGGIINAGNWAADIAVDVVTSWGGNRYGNWYNNGINSVHDIYVGGGNRARLSVSNVMDNIDGSSWTASTTSVTEPSVFALFGLGLVGIGFARRRRS